MYVFLRTEIARSDAGIFLENETEIMRVVESGFVSNISTFHLRRNEQQFRALEPDARQVFYEAFTRFLREHGAEMIRAHIDERRHRMERDIRIREVLVDILFCLADDAIVSALTLRLAESDDGLDYSADFLAEAISRTGDLDDQLMTERRRERRVDVAVQLLDNCAGGYDDIVQQIVADEIRLVLTVSKKLHVLIDEAVNPVTRHLPQLVRDRISAELL